MNGVLPKDGEVGTKGWRSSYLRKSFRKTTGFLTTNKRMMAGMFRKRNHFPASMNRLDEIFNMTKWV